ncbi:MAG: hypothetical protein AAFV59_17390 [Pseudomonadota bacterium]
MLSPEKIRELSKRVIGEDRVSSVHYEKDANEDEFLIARIRIVYFPNTNVSVEQMEEILESIWNLSSGVDDPFPIVDFTEEENGGRVAAE